MRIVLKMRNRHPLHKRLHQNRVLSSWLKRHRKPYMLIPIEHVIELFQVILLDVEINLVDESFLHGLLADWDFQAFGEDWADLADQEEELDVALNVSVDTRVTDLDCDLAAVVAGLVNLTYRAWGDWHGVELLKYLINLLSIRLSEGFLSFAEGMGWCLLS